MPPPALTPRQKYLFKTIMNKRGKDLLFEGPPGTGKTYLLSEAILPAMIETWGQTAVIVLVWMRNHQTPYRGRDGIYTHTIQEFVGHLADKEDSGGLSAAAPSSIYRAIENGKDMYYPKGINGKLAKRVVIVVEEFGGVPAETLDALCDLCYVPKKTRLPFEVTQVIMSGDPFQMPPPQGRHPLLSWFFQAQKIPPTSMVCIGEKGCTRYVHDSLQGYIVGALRQLKDASRSTQTRLDSELISLSTNGGPIRYGANSGLILAYRNKDVAKHTLKSVTHLQTATGCAVLHITPFRPDDPPANSRKRKRPKPSPGKEATEIETIHLAIGYPARFNTNIDDPDTRYRIADNGQTCTVVGWQNMNTAILPENGKLNAGDLRCQWIRVELLSDGEKSEIKVRPKIISSGPLAGWVNFPLSYGGNNRGACTYHKAQGMTCEGPLQLDATNLGKDAAITLLVGLSRKKNGLPNRFFGYEPGSCFKLSPAVTNVSKTLEQIRARERKADDKWARKRIRPT